MSTTKKTKDRKRSDPKWLYRACNCRAALELYLQTFADAKRFSAQLESKEVQLERETTDESKWSALERPFFDKGGFGGKKLHRSTVRTLINLARENARVFFPQGLQYDKEGKLIHGLYGQVLNSSVQDGPPIFEGHRPSEKTLSRIAEDDFVILAHQAILEGNGDFFRVIAEVVEQDTRPIRETLDHPLRYQVEFAHRAALELVDEAHKRGRAAGSTISGTVENGSLRKIGEPWIVDGDYYTITAINGNALTLTGKEEPHEEIDGLRCFVPTKQQVKGRMIELFKTEKIRRGRRQRWTKPNPENWSPSMWTKVFAAAGLSNLKEARGQHRVKRRKDSKQPT
jgi:hypothetical protein